MTNIDIDAIRARAKAATKGPWTIGDRKELDDPVETYELPITSPSTDRDNPELPELAVIRYYAGGYHYPHGNAKADAEFIAAAREDVPALLDLLAERDAEIKRLRAVAEAAREHASAMDNPTAPGVHTGITQRKLFEAVRALDGETRCTCDTLAEPGFPHRAWCATQHQHPSPDCAGLCEPTPSEATR